MVSEELKKKKSQNRKRENKRGLQEDILNKGGGREKTNLFPISSQMYQSFLEICNINPVLLYQSHRGIVFTGWAGFKQSEY